MNQVGIRCENLSLIMNNWQNNLVSAFSVSRSDSGELTALLSSGVHGNVSAIGI